MLIKQCSICKQGLTFTANRHKCKDGYICDDCFRLSHTSSFNLKSISIEELRKKIFNKEKIEEEAQRKIQRNHKKVAKINNDIDEFIKIDFQNQKFKFKGSVLTFDFKQLLSYEYIEQETYKHKSISSTKTNNGITRSVVGGIIAGETGAIVGAETAKTTTTTDGTINKIIDKMQIKLVISPDNWIYTIDLLDVPTEKYSNLYNITYDKAQKILNYLNQIKDENDKRYETQLAINTNQPTVKVSIPEEIKQYKELLDMGAITQEEYDMKKKQLLGL